MKLIVDYGFVFEYLDWLIVYILEDELYMYFGGIFINNWDFVYKGLILVR